MNRNDWRCEVCNLTINSKSKAKHLLSSKHLQMVPNFIPPPPPVTIRETPNFTKLSELKVKEKKELNEAMLSSLINSNKHVFPTASLTKVPQTFTNSAQSQVGGAPSINVAGEAYITASLETQEVAKYEETENRKLEYQSPPIEVKTEAAKIINEKLGKNMTNTLIAEETFKSGLVTNYRYTFKNRGITDGTKSAHIQRAGVDYGKSSPTGFTEYEQELTKQLFIRNLKDSPLPGRNGIGLAFKFWFTIVALYEKEELITPLITPNTFHEQTINTEPILISGELEIEEKLNKVYQNIFNRLTEEDQDRSGLHYRFMIKATVSIALVSKFAGSTYVPLPFQNVNIINIRNKDNKCFLWCILAYLRMGENLAHRERVSHYENYKHNIVIEKFPVDIKDIKKVEKKNNLKINIVEMKPKCKEPASSLDYFITPLHINKDFRNAINLILYEGHYLLCKNLAIFFRNKNNHKTNYPCLRCMNTFWNEERLEEHMYYCGVEEEPCKMVYEQKHDKIRFRKHYMKIKHPLSIFADVESYNEEVAESHNIDAKGNKKKRELKTIQKPSMIAMYISSDHEDLFPSQYFVFKGVDCIKEFVAKLVEMKKEIYDFLQTNNPIEMTDEDEKLFQESTKCWFCEKELGKDKVRDHDHITGKYRGAAHSECNLAAGKDKYKFCPIYFHNASGYDNHLIIKELAATYPASFTQVLAKNTENYISYTLKPYRFLDSIRFLVYSLDTLIKTLEPEDFKCISSIFKDKEQLALITRKGVYPYDYITSLETLNETELPSIDKFYSRLRNENITEEDYAHAKKVWETFKCKTLSDYTEIYLAADVLLLADIFKRFRSMCMEYYDLDPAYSFSTPGFTWEAGLKMTKIELDYIKTPEIALFIERGIRGGISGVFGNRYVKNKPDTYIKHFDAVNLYGCAMSQNLPTGDFKWVDSKDFDQLKDKIIAQCKEEVEEERKQEEQRLKEAEIKEEASLPQRQIDIEKDKKEKERISKMSKEEKEEDKKEKEKQKAEKRKEEVKIARSEACVAARKAASKASISASIEVNSKVSRGYILEVDLQYPEDIKKKTKYFPFLPNNEQIEVSRLSPYQKSLIGKGYRPQRKLICSQTDKERYVIHYRMLGFYLEHGVKITKIHKILSFNQSKWLKPYIEFNTSKRTEAKLAVDKFGIEFFKLMNNAFYGKTMENVKKRRQIELVNVEKRLLKLTSKPTFNGSKIFSENLAAVLMKKEKQIYDKPVYLGMCILDYSKLNMYSLFYNAIQPHFGHDNLNLHYMDTDSFFLEFQSDDLIRDMKALKNHFDASVLPKDHPLYSEINMNILGKLADEKKGKEITEFLAIRAKVYTYKVAGDGDVKKLKGVTSAVVKKETVFEEYYRCLFDKEIITKTNRTINSKQHTMYTIDQEKIALNPLDDKRYIMDDGITTYPHGYPINVCNNNSP